MSGPKPPTEFANRRYRLGMALVRLGDMAVGNFALADVAMPEMRKLTADLGMTSRLAILDEGYAVVVGRVDAPGAIKFDAALGRREMPHCSAVGKALLASLPASEAQSMLDRLTLPRRTWPSTSSFRRRPMFCSRSSSLASRSDRIRRRLFRFTSITFRDNSRPT